VAPDVATVLSIRNLAIDGDVVVPTATVPPARTARSDAPDDDATWNGLRLEVLVARTLNTKLDEVALIPVNTPLSMSVDVPSVVAESQRVAKPVEPPVRAEAIPSVDVATHLVDVPVDWRIIPRVPVLFVES
jgi:hypothetical protein